MSNIIRRNAIKDIFDSYELAHKKLNEDFALFKEKIDSEIAVEERHSSRLAELSSMINMQKLDGVKTRLADLGLQVQTQIDEYQDKVSKNDKMIDMIYETNKQSLTDVCEIKKIIIDIDSEICKFLDFIDHIPLATSDILQDTALNTDVQKWSGANTFVFEYKPPNNLIVNEFRFTLSERPYTKTNIASNNVYEPVFVDDPECVITVDGYSLRNKSVQLRDLGADLHELVVQTESNIMLSDKTYEMKLASNCTLNLRMTSSVLGQYSPAMKLYGCLQ